VLIRLPLVAARYITGQPIDLNDMLAVDAPLHKTYSKVLLEPGAGKPFFSIRLFLLLGCALMVPALLPVVAQNT
jgi:hypothetical protein